MTFEIQNYDHADISSPSKRRAAMMMMNAAATAVHEENVAFINVSLLSKPNMWAVEIAHRPRCSHRNKGRLKQSAGFFMCRCPVSRRREFFHLCRRRCNMKIWFRLKMKYYTLELMSKKKWGPRKMKGREWYRTPHLFAHSARMEHLTAGAKRRHVRSRMDVASVVDIATVNMLSENRRRDMVIPWRISKANRKVERQDWRTTLLSFQNQELEAKACFNSLVQEGRISCFRIDSWWSCTVLTSMTVFKSSLIQCSRFVDQISPD